MTETRRSESLNTLIAPPGKMMASDRHGAIDLCASHHPGSIGLTASAVLIVKLIGIVGGGEMARLSWPCDAEKVETGDFFTDISHIRDLTGWSPRTPLEEGLGRVLQFTREREEAPHAHAAV